MEFEIECDECRANLKTTISVDRWGKPTLKIAPCEKCLEAAREKAYSDGKEEGK